MSVLSLAFEREKTYIETSQVTSSLHDVCIYVCLRLPDRDELSGYSVVIGV